MSYNGIGLSTVRGSGTNGYIARNLSALRNDRRDVFKQQPQRDVPAARAGGGVVRADPAILEHRRKREVEVRCMQMRIDLEAQGVAEDVIEARVVELRALGVDGINAAANGTAPVSQESHELAAEAEAKNQRMRTAFGLKEDRNIGESFQQLEQQQMKETRPMLDANGQVRRPFLDRGDGPLPERKRRSPPPARRSPPRRRSPPPRRPSPPRRRSPPRQRSASPLRRAPSPARSALPTRRLATVVVAQPPVPAGTRRRSQMADNEGKAEQAQAQAAKQQLVGYQSDSSSSSSDSGAAM